MTKLLLCLFITTQFVFAQNSEFDISPNWKPFVSAAEQHQIDSASNWNLEKATSYNKINWLMFYSIDPIQQGYSPYGYCAGNPIMLIDPTGRSWNHADFVTPDQDADENDRRETEQQRQQTMTHKEREKEAEKRLNSLPASAQEAVRNGSLSLGGGLHPERSPTGQYGEYHYIRDPITGQLHLYYVLIIGTFKWIWVVDNNPANVVAQNPLDATGLILTLSFDRSIVSVNKGKTSSAGIAVNLFNGSVIKYNQSGNAIGLGGNVGFSFGINWGSSLNGFVGYDYSGTNVFKNPNGNTGSLDLVVASGNLSVDQRGVPSGVSFGVGPGLGGVVSATQHTDYNVLR
jgi:RHS repeat-associated protein